MSFAVPYGLALQGIGATRIETSLLPPEIAMERTIRRKKPWAIAAAAGLLAMVSISAIANARAYNAVSEDTFKDGHDAVKKLTTAVSANQGAYDKELAEYKKIKDNGDALTGALERRELWAEVYKAINECQPRDLTDEQRDSSDPTVKNRLKLTSITATKEEDLKTWFKDLQEELKPDDGMREDDRENGPEGVGYVFTLIGTHYRDDRDSNSEDLSNSDRSFIKNQLVNNLHKWVIERGGEIYPVRQLGITHAFLAEAVVNEISFNPNSRGGTNSAGSNPYSNNGRNVSGSGGGMLSGGGGMGLDASAGKSPPSGGGSSLALDKSDLDIDRVESRTINEWQFSVKFVWKPTAVKDRLEEEPASKPKTK